MNLNVDRKVDARSNLASFSREILPICPLAVSEDRFYQEANANLRLETYSKISPHWFGELTSVTE